MTEDRYTHEAIARHRIRNSVDWVEIGKGRLETDPETGTITCHVIMDRMPIGGFDGYVRLSPFGTSRPTLEQQPMRPTKPSDEEST
jgi:hypothetical protein